jgi:hypothetical protein
MPEITFSRGGGYRQNLADAATPDCHRSSDITPAPNLNCAAHPSNARMASQKRRDHVILSIYGIIVAVTLNLLMGAAYAHDPDNPELDGWYSGLMRPDAPSSSCCGHADAYWADEVHVRDGKTFATITDDREDSALGRPHVPNGTVIEVPNEKLKFDRGNPTGHAIIFLSMQGYVWCYVQSTGG